MEFIVLNKWQFKNKELVNAFKSAGLKVVKNRPVKLSTKGTLK